jgi:hypothetical protein
MRFFKSNRERRAQMARYASAQSMLFAEKDAFGIMEYLKDFKLFKKGGSKKILNVIYSKDADYNQKALFDYHYVVNAGNTPVQHKQTVYFRYDKNLKLPNFMMVPERWYHQVGQFFGFDDINFVLYPEFSNAYYLQGENEDFIRITFDEKLLDFFSKYHFWSLEGVNYFLVMYVDRMIQKPSVLEAFHQTGDKIYSILKEVALEIKP